MYVILDGAVGVHKQKKQNVFEDDYAKFKKKDTMLNQGGNLARENFRKNIAFFNYFKKYDFYAIF